MVISSPPRIFSRQGVGGEASCPLADLCVKTLPEAIELLPSVCLWFLGPGFHCSLPGHQSLQMSYQGSRAGGTSAPKYCIPRAQTASVLAEIESGISQRCLWKSPVLRDKQIKRNGDSIGGKSPVYGMWREGKQVGGGKGM